MRKEVKLLAVFSVALFLLAPLASATTVPVPQKNTKHHDTVRLLCIIGKQKIEKEMPTGIIDSLLLLAKSKKEAFLTIYNKYASQEDVDKAFADIQPFFAALIENGLTDKSIDELNSEFRGIREMIKKPKYNPFGPKPSGSWNGLPTFIVGNAVCGVFCGDAPAVGFALGTHTLLPTLGADLFITWAGNGETFSIGALGFTTSTGPEFGVIFGFIGVLIATPIMMVGGVFMTGFAAFYLGIGPAPF